MSTRIYRLTIAGKVRLIRAAHPAQAIAHVAKDSIIVNVASQDDLVRDLSAGVKVENPGEPAQAALPEVERT